MKPPQDGRAYKLCETIVAYASTGSTVSTF